MFKSTKKAVKKLLAPKKRKKKSYMSQAKASKLITSVLTKAAKKAKQPFDVVTENGLLVRGAIYYKKSPTPILNLLHKQYKIPKKMVQHEPRKKRILTHFMHVESLHTDLKRDYGAKVAVVEEFPPLYEAQLEVVWL